MSAAGSLPNVYPELRENPKTPLAKRRDPDSTERMIRPGFLDIELRQNLIELARDGSAAHRLARRANALVLLGACPSSRCSSLSEFDFNLGL